LIKTEPKIITTKTDRFFLLLLVVFINKTIHVQVRVAIVLRAELPITKAYSSPSSYCMAKKKKTQIIACNLHTTTYAQITSFGC